MNPLRVGTRGSDLALIQTRGVCQQLQTRHPSLVIEEVIIKTHGDVSTGQLFSDGWPAGGFVGAIERALIDRRVDFAVHSYKDLPIDATPGLTIAAVLVREVAHDVLVTREPVALDRLPHGIRIGTSSPRRAAQMRRLAGVEIVPIRGNVPTRLAKIDAREVDAVVLAAAGLKRLGIDPPHRIDLPLEWFPPAPGQGSLALQAREDDERMVERLAVLDDAATRRAVDTERAFVQAIGGGCHTAVGTIATVRDGRITLYGQLFLKDGERPFESVLSGRDPKSIGKRMAQHFKDEVEDAP
jgi:hydroxymethylbilane synthase